MQRPDRECELCVVVVVTRDMLLSCDMKQQDFEARPIETVMKRNSCASNSILDNDLYNCFSFQFHEH